MKKATKRASSAFMPAVTKGDSARNAPPSSGIDLHYELLGLRENILNLTEEPDPLIILKNKLSQWSGLAGLREKVLLEELDPLIKQPFVFQLLEKKEGNFHPRKKRGSHRVGNEKRKKSKNPSLKKHIELIEKKTIELLCSPLASCVEGMKETFELLLNYYRHSLTQIAENKSRLKAKVILQHPSLGHYLLTPAAGDRFASYFDGVSSETEAEKDNEYGCHSVIKMGGIYWKIDPTAAGFEYAVHRFNEFFTGQASAPAELVMLHCPIINTDGEIEEKTLAVLASKSVIGTLLLDLLREGPKKIKNYGLLFFSAVFTKPEDGKPENFMARPSFDSRGKLLGYEVVGIDNDEALTDLIIHGKFGHYLKMKTIMFCMPQIEDRIDPELRKQLLGQNAAVIVIKWLHALSLYNEAHKYNQRDFDAVRLKALGLPIQFVPGTAVELYKTLSVVQSILSRSEMMTYREILSAVYPLVGRYYDHIRETFGPDLLAAMDKGLYNGPSFEDLNLSLDEQEDLEQYTHGPADYVKGRTQSLLDACVEFLKHFNFSELSLTEQNEVLEHLTVCFPRIARLTINHCDALGELQLLDMANRRSNLETLTLVDCKQVTSSGLNALISRFPRLNLTLDGFEHFSAHDLLSIMRHCEHFYLILKDGLKHHVHISNTHLFKPGLAEENPKFLTFLLLAGFRLGDNESEYSALHEAISQKDPLLVSLLIRYRVGVNKHFQGRSPLNFAYSLCDDGKLASKKIIVMLVKAGAIDCQPDQAVSILAMALETPLTSNEALGFKRQLLQFALCHNCLTPTLISTLVPATETILTLEPPAELRMGGNQLSAEIITALLTHVTEIKELNVSGCAGFSSPDIDACFKKNISKLTLDLNQAITAGMILAPDVIKDSVTKAQGGNPSSLFRLNSSDHNNGLKSRTTTPSKRSASNVLSVKKKWSCVNINAASLKGRKEVEKNFPALISVLLNPRHSLFSLEITNAKLNDEQFSQLMEALAANSTLHHLVLRGVGLHDARASGLTKALASHPLEVVDFSSNQIAGEESKAMAKLISSHPKLRSLSFYDNPLGDSGLKTLCRAFQSHSALLDICLNQIACGDEGFKVLVNAIIQCGSVTKLDIGYNNLTSAPDLNSLVRLNLQLTDLHFDGNKFSDASISAVKCRLMRNNKSSEERELLCRHREASMQQNQRVDNVERGLRVGSWQTDASKDSARSLGKSFGGSPIESASSEVPNDKGVHFAC